MWIFKASASRSLHLQVTSYKITTPIPHHSRPDALPHAQPSVKALTATNCEKRKAYLNPFLRQLNTTIFCCTIHRNN